MSVPRFLFVLSVWGQPIFIFCIFIFRVLSSLLLKGVAENSLLFKDEILTPNIGKVMGGKFSEGRLK